MDGSTVRPEEDVKRSSTVLRADRRDYDCETGLQ